MKKIIYLICCLFLFTGCNNNQIKKQSSTLSEVIEKDTIIEPDFSDIVRPNLLKEIKEFTSGAERDEDFNIVMVVFLKGKSECELVFFSVPSYNNQLIGHLIMDDKMVAFYCFEDACIDGWVDKSKLIKTPPADYPDEDSESAPKVDYEPYGKKFKLNNEEMALELIRSGLL